MAFHFASHKPNGMRIMIRHTARGNEKFEPLPQPTGEYPYRLDLSIVIGSQAVEKIIEKGEITFHIVGDTGGVKDPKPQQVVALKMEEDLKQTQDEGHNASFFYHLGDIIYYNGEASRYYEQFYYPYEKYNRPIFAIPGNHDGGVGKQKVASLQGFVNNFCTIESRTTPEAGDTPRTSMIQPNVYFTLVAPFVNIVGLYTNVPEGGIVDEDQKEWFINEMKEAPMDKALIITMHHPIYSLDDHHSGSEAMHELLMEAIEKSGRIPDAVFAAHVHNYQRFTRTISPDREIPFIVAGSGGYWHLHYVGKLPDGTKLTTPITQPDLGVTLESYNDDHHGFVKITISSSKLLGKYYIAPRPQNSFRKPAELFDTFQLDLQTHKLERIILDG